MGGGARRGLTLRALPAPSFQAQAGGPSCPCRPPRPGVQLLVQFAGRHWVPVWRCTGHRLNCGVCSASSPLLGGVVGWLVWSLSPPPCSSPTFPSGSSPVSSLSPGLAHCLCPGTSLFHFYSCDDDSTSLSLCLSSSFCPSVFPSRFVSAVPPLSFPASPQVGLSCRLSPRWFCQLDCLSEESPRRLSPSALESLVQSALEARGLSAWGFPTGRPPPPPRTALGHRVEAGLHSVPSDAFVSPSAEAWLVWLGALGHP